VWERSRKISGWLDSRDRKIVPYKGKVYCATVSQHILFVRRNGKPVWCGNTVIRCVDRSKLASKVLKPIEEAVRASGHIGYWDVNCIIDENGDPWPLEHTARFGYPTWNIQQQLLKGDPVEFLEGVARGRMTKAWDTDNIAVGVVLSIPDYPYSNITRKEVVGVPILGLRDGDLPNIHPCEIMMGDSWQMVGEEVMQVPGWVTGGDYVLVASGKGADVRQARERAYRILSRLTETPSSVMYRTDIGMKLKHQLPELQSKGYALMMSYASSTS
jgi:phosphoribosylamine--glycine ligase